MLEIVLKLSKIIKCSLYSAKEGEKEKIRKCFTTVSLKFIWLFKEKVIT
jgi:hypothetical protein